MSNRLIAIGDIHGCFDAFKELVENKIRLKKSDKLVLLGDYIDRGKQSQEVIDYIMLLLQNRYDVIPLIGNHEVLLLDAMEDDNKIPNWIQNGGEPTMTSFNISTLKELEPKYVSFLQGLSYYYLFESYLFVHAGFNDHMANPFLDKRSMTWTCKEAYLNPILSDKTIVHGHCPIPLEKSMARIRDKNPVINIDTGCVYKDKPGYGVLSAFVCHLQELVFV